MAQGYVVDSPRVLMKSKNNITQIMTAKKGEIKVSGESISINGGWSAVELAEIDTKQKIEIDITDAQFKMSNLALQTGVAIKKGKSERYVFDEAYIVNKGKITVPYAIVAGSVEIIGLTETTGATPAKGQFKVTTTSNSTDITFDATEYVDGVELMPVFRVAIDDAEILSVTGTDSPKSGFCVMEYPVYGENEAKEDTIIGYVQWIIYKAKVKSDFGMGGSYKNASEFNMKIKGLDAMRPDKKIFDVVFRPAVK